MRMLLVLVLGLWVASAAVAAESGAPEPAAMRAVLVTGASAGIGRKVTERLAAAGFHVFAGARKPQDIEALSKLPNVTGVRLDVNSTADIAAAVELVRASGHALHGLVNNAGVVVIDPVLSMTDEDFDFQMQANVYGKLAVEGFTNVLAAELAPHGVSVIAIEPGAYNTDILKPALERSRTKGFDPDRSKLKPPDEVAAAVLLALTEPKPKRRYMVVPERAQAEDAVRGALELAVQLNGDQAYSYDRAALIRLLDESSAKVRP